MKKKLLEKIIILDCGTSAVLLWLLPSSFLEGPLPLLISGSDFLALRFCGL